ncbi:hypothetical protein [Halobacteriovorax sp. DA5]|uniref:hypothetical protein n=1 Tax=Halobacteriovorax sp. DA5 TaxID=2067553 RepID=UPI000CD0F12A|nr:hypothetical protein [Halobacteriovorax sp. DA5]POB12790.1 hypothetical protein C0Z22_12980 [Halobacteriovorax sp. DA5]
MKYFTLPFLFVTSLLSLSVYASEAKELHLRGRVPASVVVVDEVGTKEPNDAIKSNLDKNSYDVKKSEKNGHPMIEISFH